MNQAAQQPDVTASQKLPLRLRVLFFYGDPLVSLIVLMVAVLTAIVGAVAGKSSWVLCGIALAISAIGLLALVLLMALDALNGRAGQVIASMAALHDTEMEKLTAAQRQPSSLKLGSFFKN